MFRHGSMVKAALAAVQVFANREAVTEYEKALEDDPRETFERAGILDALVVLLWRQNLIERAMVLCSRLPIFAVF